MYAWLCLGHEKSNHQSQSQHNLNLELRLISFFISLFHRQSTPIDTATMTAAPALDILAEKRRELLALDTRKKSLQSEAEAIVSELTAELPGGVSNCNSF